MPDSKIVNTGLFEMLNTPYVVRGLTDLAENPLQIWSGTATKPGFLDPTNKIPDFSEWVSYLHNDHWVKNIAKIGTIAQSIQEKEIRKIAHGAQLCTWNNHKIYICNSNVQISDLGAYLYSSLDACDFVLMWRFDHTQNACYVSLRSHQQTGADVSVVASSFGGGGHRNAAGFTCTLSTLQRIMLELS